MMSEKNEIERNDLNKDNFAIFHINGNPEKDLIATSVINSFKEFYPNKKIVVVSNFPEIWLHNPDVYRIYKLGNAPYFYEDFISNKESEIFAKDPYLTNGFIYGKKLVAEVWCDILNIPYNGSLPKLHFTQREKEVAWRLSNNGKPILLIQGNEIFSPFPNLPFNWTKDISINVLQKISNEAMSKGYIVLQIRNQNQPEIAGAMTLGLSLRLSLAILNNVKKVITIDSFISQACAAFQKEAVVTWIKESAENRGYKIHKNIQAKLTDQNTKEQLENYSPLFDLEGEKLKQIPNVENFYSAEDLIKALEL